MTVSTGLKGSQFDRFGGSHSAQKFGLAHTTRHARGARETPDTGHSKFRCLDINANRHPPAPSARKAIVKREEIPRTEEAAAALPIAGLPRRGSYRGSGRGLLSAVSGVSCSCGVSMRYWRRTRFSSKCSSEARKRTAPEPWGTSRFRGLQPSFQQTRKSSLTFTLTSKVKGQYFHLECLPKNNENASNYCREPWTC